MLSVETEQYLYSQGFASVGENVKITRLMQIDSEIIFYGGESEAGNIHPFYGFVGNGYRVKFAIIWEICNHFEPFVLRGSIEEFRHLFCLFGFYRAVGSDFVAGSDCGYYGSKYNGNNKTIHRSSLIFLQIYMISYI